MLFGLPGKLTIRVEPRIPATARESIQWRLCSREARRIASALRHARDRPLVVIACDMPFADAGLLGWLASAPEPLVVPSVAGRLQPLHARYDPALLPLLEAALGRAEPLQETVASLEPRVIEEKELARFGDPHRICFNVNAAEDLERAEEL